MRKKRFVFLFKSNDTILTLIVIALLLNSFIIGCAIERPPTRVMIKVKNATLPMKILFYENRDNVPSTRYYSEDNYDTFRMLDNDSLVSFTYDYTDIDFPGMYVQNEISSDSEAVSRVLVTTEFHDYNYLELPILKRPSIDMEGILGLEDVYNNLLAAGLSNESGYYIWSDFRSLPGYVFLGKRIKFVSFYEEKNNDEKVILSCRSTAVEIEIPMDSFENVAKDKLAELRLYLGTEFTNELTDEKFENRMEYIYGDQPNEIRIDLGRIYDSIYAIVIYDLHSRYYHPKYAFVEDTSQMDEPQDSFDLHSENYHVLWFGNARGRYFILKSNYHNIESLREIAIIRKN